MAKKCSVCESEDLEPGGIQSTGKIYFRPKNARFLSIKTANVEIKATLCLRCGHLDLIADPQQASALLGKAKTH